MDAQVGGRPILLHRGENMLHRVSTSTSSRHRASPLCFPSWKPFTQPSPRFLSPSFSLSLSEASPCAFVRLSVYPLYMCLWLAALCFARQASYFFSPAPLLPFPLPLSLSLLVFPFTELLWLLWSEKLGQPHTCSHLSADTGEGHGPAGSNEHAPSSPDPIIGSF